MSFFPLDREIESSSLWAEPPHVLKVWLHILLNASRATGIFKSTEPAIGVRCGLPLNVVHDAIMLFMRPDPHSRSKQNKGRRLVKVPGGWRVVTFLAHRDKDYSTPRVQAFRKRRKETTKPVSTDTETTDRDTDTNTKGEKVTPPPASAPLFPAHCPEHAAIEFPPKCRSCQRVREKLEAATAAEKKAEESKQGNGTEDPGPSPDCPTCRGKGTWETFAHEIAWCPRCYPSRRGGRVVRDSEPKPPTEPRQEDRA